MLSLCWPLDSGFQINWVRICLNSRMKLLSWMLVVVVMWLWMVWWRTGWCWWCGWGWCGVDGVVEDGVVEDGVLMVRWWWSWWGLGLEWELEWGLGWWIRVWRQGLPNPKPRWGDLQIRARGRHCGCPNFLSLLNQ